MLDTLLIKTLILFLLLLYASINDIRTHHVEDVIPFLIGSIALIGISLSDIPGMFLSAFIIALPMFCMALIKPGEIGGADIKLTAACAFLLGIQKGLVFIVLGLFLAVICNLVLKKLYKDRYKEPFALIPYLSIGCMIAYFMNSSI